MHLITGFLLAGLLGRKQSSHRSRLPTFPGVIETVHLLPGRVRFRAPNLVGRRIQAEELEKRLAQISGLLSASVNSVSGSICLQFESERVKPEMLLAAIVRLLGLEKEIGQRPRSLIGREIRETGDALNRAMFQRSGGMIDFYTAMPLLLLAVGFRNIAAGRVAGWTLVWWAYRTLFPPAWNDQ
jgi:hypothetical protein